MTGLRTEVDSLGSVTIEEDSLWGAQTQRSVNNFKIGNEKIPFDLIREIVRIKMASAITNKDLGKLNPKKCELIVRACHEILEGKFNEQFPTSVWQTGSGTHSNMNVNEIIANLCSIYAARPIGGYVPVHPNDDVNMSQSSNDVFGAAMHICAFKKVKNDLLPALEELTTTFKQKSSQYSQIVKVGRTHLMDAVPITLGQEFSGYADQLESAGDAVFHSSKKLRQIALGATAVGTGINSHPEYSGLVIKNLSRISMEKFYPSENMFSALACHDPIVSVSGDLRRLAVALLKIANDIRWMASGPRCGLMELTIPANEPGSSIMPGKINPSQCEAMIMVCMQVMGNDQVIALAGSQGNFELNVCKPVIIYNLLQSIALLSDAMRSLNANCINDLAPNIENIKQLTERSLIGATALAKTIGYDQAARIIKSASEEGISIADALKMEGLHSMEKNLIIDLLSMTRP